MEAKLVLVQEDGRSGELKLRVPTILGRSRQAGLTVLHTSVSRQHCEFTEYEGELVVTDLGSLNGTFIGETRITEPTILPHGALLRVGSVRFQVVYGEGSDLDPPVAARQLASDHPEKPAARGPEKKSHAPAEPDDDDLVPFPIEDQVEHGADAGEAGGLSFLFSEGSGPAEDTNTPEEELELTLDDVPASEDRAAKRAERPAAVKKGAAQPAPRRPATAGPSPGEAAAAKPSTPRKDVAEPKPISAAKPAASKPAASKPAPSPAPPPPAADDPTAGIFAETEIPAGEEAALADDLDSFFDSLQ